MSAILDAAIYASRQGKGQKFLKFSPEFFVPGATPLKTARIPICGVLGCHREGAGRAVDGIHGGVTLGGVDLAIGEKSESETHGKRV
jgi:hypothetical protein